MRGADAPSATAASRARVGALDRRQRESDQDRQRNQHLTDDHGRLGEPQMPLAEDALPRQQQVEDQSGDNGRRGEQALRDDDQPPPPGKSNRRQTIADADSQRHGDQHRAQRHRQGYADDAPERRVGGEEQPQGMQHVAAVAFPFELREDGAQQTGGVGAGRRCQAQIVRLAGG